MPRAVHPQPVPAQCVVERRQRPVGVVTVAQVEPLPEPQHRAQRQHLGDEGAVRGERRRPPAQRHVLVRLVEQAVEVDDHVGRAAVRPAGRLGVADRQCRAGRCDRAGGGTGAVAGQHGGRHRDHSGVRQPRKPRLTVRAAELGDGASGRDQALLGHPRQRPVALLGDRPRLDAEQFLVAVGVTAQLRQPAGAAEPHPELEDGVRQRGVPPRHPVPRRLAAEIEHDLAGPTATGAAAHPRGVRHPHLAPLATRVCHRNQRW